VTFDNPKANSPDLHQNRERLSSRPASLCCVNLRPLIQPAADWLDDCRPKRAVDVALTACAGLMLYGFTVGFWRSPLMGVYVALKFPLLIFLTLSCNALLNGLLGTLLGTRLGFRQSWFALLSSFALAALILGSLAPVTFLLAWNTPPPDSPGAVSSHAAYLLTHTLLIAFAGISANVHLHRLLGHHAPTPLAAKATLFAWLAGNGFLGAQFSWILRPFFGSPSLEVAFLRPHPLRGNFYESVWRSLDRITGGNPIQAVSVAVILAAAFTYPLLRKQRTKRP
jgi:hypothetical protein